jgi:hypothetical protein
LMRTIFRLICLAAADATRWLEQAIFLLRTDARML